LRVGQGKGAGGRLVGLLIVQRRQIFLCRTAGLVLGCPVNRLAGPNGMLATGIGCYDTCIDSESFALNQASGNALPNDALKEPPKNTALAETPMSVL